MEFWKRIGLNVCFKTHLKGNFTTIRSILRKNYFPKKLDLPTYISLLGLPDRLDDSALDYQYESSIPTKNSVYM